MTPTKSGQARQRPGGPPDLEPVLLEVTKKLEGSEMMKDRPVLVRTTGPGGRDYYLGHERDAPRLLQEAPGESTPAIEIVGDARSIAAVLSGKKDARAQFFAGGFRLRGDLRYASDLAMALGILKVPL